MKTCSACGADVPAKNFYKDKSKKDGLSSRCRPCVIAYQKNRREDPEYRESMRKYCYEYGKKYRARPDYLEKERAYREKRRSCPDTREADLLASRAADKKMRKNPEFLAKKRKYMKEYVRNNPEKYAAYNHKRRARIRSAKGEFSEGDIQSLLILQRFKCAYCKTCVKDGYHIDHIVALANGGNNSRGNIQILCPFCNMSKGAKCPIKFAQEKGLLL